MLKDIKDMMRSSKRPNNDDFSTRASLMDVMTGRVIPIEEDTEHSSSGTFLNCKRLSRSTNNITELEQGDLIGFGDKKITKTFKFILNKTANKRPRLYNKHGILEVHNTEATFKNTITKRHKEVLDLKADQIALRNKVKTELAEMQNMMNNIVEITSDSLKQKFYSQLENEFQCSICSELVCKAMTINCSHTFCDVCIKTWLNISKVCPICRTSVNTVTNCLALDNYINKICNFIGGVTKDQRQLLLKQRLVLSSTAKSSRKRGSSN